MRRYPVLAAVALLLAVIAPPAFATTRMLTTVEERAIAECIERSAGGRSWLSKTLWGLRDQEGGWPGAAIENGNGTQDLGPLQVNSWWVSRIATLVGRHPAEARWWLQHDICFNVDAARWIFLSALAVTHDYWKAVGVYHSPVGWRQRRYARGVADHLRQRFGPDIFTPHRSVSIQRSAVASTGD